MYRNIYQLVKSSAIYGMGISGMQLTGVILVPIYTRVFSTSDYGIIDMIAAGMVLLTAISWLQINSGVTRHYYEAKKEGKESLLLSTGLFSFLGFAVLVCSIVILLGEQISLALFATDEYTIILAVATMSIPFTLLFQYLILILRFENEALKYSIFSFAHFLLLTSLCILLVVPLKMGILGVFLAHLLSAVFLSLCSLVLSARQFKLTFSLDYAWKIFAFGLPTVPIPIAEWVRLHISRFVLASFLSTSVVGLFSLAWKVSLLVSLFDSAFLMAWVPLSMSIIGEKYSEETYVIVLRYYLILMTSVASILAIFAYELVSLVAPPQYREASVVVGLLAGTIVVKGGYNVVTIGINIVKKTYLKTVSCLIGATATVLLLIILVPSLGLIGAAIASLIGTSIMTAMTYYFAQKNYPIRYEVSKVVWGLALFVGVIVFSIYANSMQPLSIRYTLKAIVLLGFLFGVYATAVNKNEVSFVKSIISDKLRPLLSRAPFID